MLLVSNATAAPHLHNTITPCSTPTTAKQFREFSAAVWNRDHWERGKPKSRTVAVMFERRLCAASPAHRKAMRSIWRRDKRQFYRYRNYRLRWGTCRHNAPPGSQSVRDCIEGGAETYGQSYSYLLSVATCESQLNRLAQNPSGASGLFQFMVSTWASTPYGGHSIWSARWQSLAAAWMFRHGRSGEWVCA